MCIRDSQIPSVQRRGDVGVACFYRTVSEPAGIIPTNLTAQEGKQLYKLKVDTGGKVYQGSNHLLVAGALEQ